MLKKIAGFFRGLPKKQRKLILTRLCSVVESVFNYFRFNVKENFYEFVMALTAVLLFATTIVIFMMMLSLYMM